MVKVMNNKEFHILTDVSAPIAAKDLINILNKYITNFKNPILYIENVPYGYDTINVLTIKDKE